ncbi:unnamed protein product [Leptosia nina]|uniref:Uncharacterized protein n=1 Tax=Leptosia nina TaxID=320188 RepID=A0AAV1J5Q0_9NEOP
MLRSYAAAWIQRTYSEISSISQRVEPLRKLPINSNFAQKSTRTTRNSSAISTTNYVFERSAGDCQGFVKVQIGPIVRRVIAAGQWAVTRHNCR